MEAREVPALAEAELLYRHSSHSRLDLKRREERAQLVNLLVGRLEQSPEHLPRELVRLLRVEISKPPLLGESLDHASQQLVARQADRHEDTGPADPRPCVAQTDIHTGAPDRPQCSAPRVEAEETD